MSAIKNLIRKILSPILHNRNVENILKKRYLFRNYRDDAEKFHQYASAFNENDILNKEANLILNYHSLEKGMLFNKMKSGYGAYRINNLHKLLADPDVIDNIDRSQIRVAYEVMCKYYELQTFLGYEIEALFSKQQYEAYKSILGKLYNPEFEGVLHWNRSDFYKDIKSDFSKFSNSRKSVRNFTGELVEKRILEQVVELANNAPSVCNRQASKVYILEDKTKIDKVLKIQDGFNGYTGNVRQLIILTNDRRYYYTTGERNQLFIDGGIYLLNLLYALHYFHVANCPANWAKTTKEELPIYDVLDLPKSEKIICLIPIGVSTEEFRTTLSKRRTVDENLFFIN